MDQFSQALQLLLVAVVTVGIPAITIAVVKFYNAHVQALHSTFADGWAYRLVSAAEQDGLLAILETDAKKVLDVLTVKLDVILKAHGITLDLHALETLILSEINSNARWSGTVTSSSVASLVLPSEASTSGSAGTADKAGG